MLSAFDEGEACRRACILYLPSYSRHIFRHVTDRRDNESTPGINVFHVSNFSLLFLPIFWSWRDESWINAALPQSCLSAIIYTHFNITPELYFTFLDRSSGLSRATTFGPHFVHAVHYMIRSASLSNDAHSIDKTTAVANAR